MRVSQEKSKLFKKSVEYLGFIVSQGGLRTSPEKVKTIKEFPPPKTLFNLRSFLGLASYYRCFIKNFATIARPLTNILKGENGKTSQYQSRKIDINMNKEQRKTFDRLREIWASEVVWLSYPDFKRPLDFTMDASDFGLGRYYLNMAAQSQRYHVPCVTAKRITHPTSESSSPLFGH